MPMTSEAKRELSKTIRALRAYLLQRLEEAAESEYRLQLPIQDAELGEAQRVQRRRLEEWLSEQIRAEAPKNDKAKAALRERFLGEVVKQAAYTLLNRHVYLRLLEGFGLRKPLLTGGWNSRLYKDFRDLAPDLCRDESEGYAFLLELVYNDLATELPGLFHTIHILGSLTIPASVLRHLIEELDKPELLSCWSDDMTLGWVYQYWNDPEREAIDAKLNSGGKVENHELASKTQLFTERYMVDWLLQNSIGAKWLAICQKNGWTADVEANGTLDRLETRRGEWRQKREAEEVSLTDLIPLDDAEEERWVYYVPQECSDADSQYAPESIRDLRLLDPACGSGHFLVIAMDLLFAAYKEEAKHRGEQHQSQWSEKAIVESILTHNLHGLDIDPRAVQIAAAALWLKAKLLCQDASPQQMNLVASNLQLSQLPHDDPARVELRQAAEDSVGLPAELTDMLLDSLEGADHLGSLLKVGLAVDEAVQKYEQSLGLEHFRPDGETLLERHKTRDILIDKLEAFLSKIGGGNDLGLRLKCQQLATGARLIRLLQENHYDLVVGNPPYQGTSKMADKKYLEKQYKAGKADLYAAFLMRGLQLCKEGGYSALLTMRGWMFINQYSKLRELLQRDHHLKILGDVDKGAFSEISGEVVTAVMSIFANNTAPEEAKALAIRPTPTDVRGADSVQRKRAGLLCQAERFAFDVQALKGIEGWPLVYWWGEAFLQRYLNTPKIGETAPVREGMSTSDNTRFVFRPWEMRNVVVVQVEEQISIALNDGWVPTIMGAKSTRWIEPLQHVVRWQMNGLEMKVLQEDKYGSASRRIQSQDLYFKRGVAYSAIGHSFSARKHFYRSIFGSTGSSVFPDDCDHVVCLLNSSYTQSIASDLNPTIHFTQGDVCRIPLVPKERSRIIANNVKNVFIEQERHREISIEFLQPGPSAWNYAQEWAQCAVDREDGEPLSPFDPVYEEEPATDHISYAMGVALGRFGPNGEGILDPSKDDLTHALPHGILFLNGTLDETDHSDSLGHEASHILHNTWKEKGPDIAKRLDLRTYLRTKFFGDVHLGMYDKRPIHWPLTSANKTFVAYITIHRLHAQTLRNLQAFHLAPVAETLEKKLHSHLETRSSSDEKAAKQAEKEYATTQKVLEELNEFIDMVQQCSEQGPPPTDGKCPPRDADALYDPDLDDGVMINSAALWPLLQPQWKDPGKWWKEMATAKGKKDYDWARLAKKYWPDRVEEKCKEDPSLGVAHGCFWTYHPERAWAWELRLQQEIGPDFTIDEEGSDEHRYHYLLGESDTAIAAIEKEVLRREKKLDDPQHSITLNRPGLWKHHPEKMWALEEKLIARFKRPFHIEAPDEEEGRATYTGKHPESSQQRDALLNEHTPKQTSLL